MFGLSDEIINKIKNVGIKNNIEIYIFGSRARGDYKYNSDIDIVIKEYIMQDKEYRILDDIDKIDTEYKIDVVFIQNIKNKYIKGLENLKNFLEKNI